MTEKSIKAAIQRYLKKKGAWNLKIWGSGIGRTGIPDLLCCYRGRFIALEVKVPGNTATKLQEYEINQIRAAGGIAAVVHSKDEVEAIIQDFEDGEIGEK